MEKVDSTADTEKILSTLRSKKATGRKLYKERALIFIDNGPGDLLQMRKYGRWIKLFSQERERIIARLESGETKVRDPLIKATLVKAIQSLREEQYRTRKLLREFEAGVQGHHAYLETIKADRELSSGKKDTNRMLALLSRVYGGYAQLRRIFERAPEMVPPGINPDITAEAIRKRVRKVSFAPKAKSGRSAQKK